MTVQELKGEAYDVIAQIQFLQKKLQELNAEISEAIQKEAKEAVDKSGSIDKK